MIPACTGPYCTSLMHRDRLRATMLGRLQVGRRDAEGIARAATAGDEPDGAIAVRHALPPGLHGLATIASY